MLKPYETRDMWNPDLHECTHSFRLFLSGENPGSNMMGYGLSFSPFNFVLSINILPPYNFYMP